MMGFFDGLKRTEFEPYQVCINCCAVSDPGTNDTFLAWPDNFGKPVDNNNE